MAAPMPRLPTGKLPAELLSQLLSRLPSGDPRVVLGPGIGRDAAVIDMGDRYLVAKTDPITFATDEIGWYAVNINANDIACLGARPRWFMVTALLPATSADAAMAEAIFTQITDACTELGIALVGGHTEVTHDLNRPVLVGAMLGEVEKAKLVTADRVRVGDTVCLTKGIPLEATALLAREKRDELLRRGVSGAVVQRAHNLLHVPGISVVREALIAADAGLAKAMHDPTEGGLATGLEELAQAAHVGLEIDGDAIPLLSEGSELCSRYGLDPLGAIASGALLIVTSDAARLETLLRDAGITCQAIGRVTPQENGVMLLRNGRREPLPRFEVDEIARVFE